MVRIPLPTDRTRGRDCEVTESAHAFTKEAEVTDRGFTLVEILIAIVLIAVAVLAVLQAWRFGFESSGRHRAQADVQNVLTSASERVLDPTFAAQPCNQVLPPPTPTTGPGNQAAIAAEYQAQARLARLPEGWPAGSITVSPADVAYWNGGTTGTIWGPVCYEANGLRVTQVTITVRSPDGKAEGRLQVVKSDV